MSQGAPEPRLKSRPLWRPPVDPAVRGIFGRPGGVEGPFAPGPRPVNGGAKPMMLAPPIPEMLIDAFGRPAGQAESLQRGPAPDAAVSLPAVDPNPWRDGDSPVRLGPPAVDEPAADAPAALPEVRYTLREAVFAKKLRPGALIFLAVAALVIGAAGAGIGSLLVSRIPAALGDPGFSLTTVQPAVSREPGSISDIAGRVTPAVVSIEIQIGQGGGSGSGVVIDGAQGYILTNNHVISMAATNGEAVMSVVFSDGSRVPAQIVGRDIRTDLAVIKVAAVNLTVAQLGDSAALAVGDSVIAIGSPLGLAGTVTTGIVSAVNRPVRLSGAGTDTDAVIDAIQTDASINPGNSGGALVDSTGAVVGINSAIRTLGGEASGSIGLGFAIPINLAKPIAEELIRTGTALHATIGVDARSVSDGTTQGAQVQNVRTDSPAAAAGILEGDVIVKVGDRTVGNADELIVAVQSHNVGDVVPVELVRAGRSFTVEVTLASE